jgi:hypothetical protein
MIRVFPAGLAVVIMLFTAGGVQGGYVLELQNGGEIIVNDYWNVDNEIRYARYGGVVGLPADEVKDIRSTDEKLLKTDAISSRAGGLIPSPRKPERAGGEQPEVDAGNTVVESPVEATAEELRYMPEFEELKNRFGNLSSMNQQDMLTFSEELTGFRNKVLSEGLGHIYNPQILEIYDMGERLEQVYKERYQ